LVCSAGCDFIQRKGAKKRKERKEKKYLTQRSQRPQRKSYRFPFYCRVCDFLNAEIKREAQRRKKSIFEEKIDLLARSQVIPASTFSLAAKIIFSFIILINARIINCHPISQPKNNMRQA
jgi:hypothetical protein